MEQENIANRISMLSYWKNRRPHNIVFYLRNYNYEIICARRILKWEKSHRTGIWYVVISTLSGKILKYRIDDIIIMRPVDRDFTTLDMVKRGRTKMFKMQKAGRLTT